MRPLLLTVLITCLSIVLTQAQQVIPDVRLASVYDATWLANMSANNPNYIRRLNYYLEYSWYLVDVPAGKAVGSTTIKVDDINNINIYQLEKLYGVHRQWALPTTYPIEGTNKMLVLYAGRDMVKKWNDFNNLPTPDLRRGVQFTAPKH